MPIKNTDTVINCIIANANQHAYKWDKNISDDHKLVVLLRELGELSNSLYEKHEHPPELELIQISGICINWLRRFPEDKVILALEQTTKEHQQRGT